MPARSFTKFFTCSLFVVNVASLSTSFLQGDALTIEEGFAQAIPPSSKPSGLAELLSDSEVPVLNQTGLRGANATSLNTNWQFHMDGEHGTPPEEAQAIAFTNALNTAQISSTKLLAASFVALVLILGLGVLCFADEDSAEQEQMPPKTVEELENSQSKYRQIVLAMEGHPGYGGTWAQTYENANEKIMKQGLELLFRCHIIPAEEWAETLVSQEHVDECVWITHKMLKERPLEQWLENCPEAQNEFNANVTACFEEKMQLGKDEPSFDNKAGIFSNVDTMERAPKGATRPEAKPDLLPVLRTASDRKSLMESCRRIMAVSDAGRRWKSASSDPRLPDASVPAGPSWSSAPAMQTQARPGDSAAGPSEGHIAP